MKKTDNKKHSQAEKSIAEIACAGRPERMPAIFLTFFKRNANEQHKNRQ